MEVDSGVGALGDSPEEERLLPGLSLFLLSSYGRVLTTCFCDWSGSEGGVGSFSEMIRDSGRPFLLCLSHTLFVILLDFYGDGESYTHNYSITRVMVLMEQEK